MPNRKQFYILIAAFLFVSGRMSPSEPQYPPSLLGGLQWRDVGPMRGGRTFGVAGHANQPDTFYFGSVGGGVWKTENAGRTWFPISDEGIPVGSIGAIAVAPSNPDILYVGTGESDIRSQHSYGNGMYKSIDAGKTWTHIGLEAPTVGRAGRRFFPMPSGLMMWERSMWRLIRRTRVCFMRRYGARGGRRGRFTLLPICRAGGFTSRLTGATPGSV
jgi:hypothetical protein